MGALEPRRTLYAPRVTATLRFDDNQATARTALRTCLYRPSQRRSSELEFQNSTCRLGTPSAVTATVIEMKYTSAVDTTGK